MHEKLKKIMNGEAVVVGNDFLDSVELPDGVVTIPNPDRLGVQDAYLAGLVTHPDIQAYRSTLGVIENDRSAFAELTILSELVEYGKDEEGRPYLGECYQVIATDSLGRQYVNPEVFHGCKAVKIDDPDEYGIYFEDTRAEAQQAAGALLAKLQNSDAPVDFKQWMSIGARYGSQMYNEQDLIDFEREQDLRP